MDQKKNIVVVVGAGAAGLMAAIQLARRGIRVILLEGKKRAGIKILMSGGGRCNVTNVMVTERDYVSGCPRTVRHVLKTFPSKEVVDFFQAHDVELVLENGQQYFSADGRAQTVLSALLRAARESGVDIRYHHKVTQVFSTTSGFVVHVAGTSLDTPYLVVTTGGLSYPTTGSTGFGYHLAQQFNHTLIPTAAALTPLRLTQHSFPYKKLSGISLPVVVTLWSHHKKVRTEKGGMLFTHFGISGPTILNISRFWKQYQKDASTKITIDFLPSVTDQHSVGEIGSKKIGKHLSSLMPERLALALLEHVDVSADMTWSSMTKDQRQQLCHVVRAFEPSIQDVYGYGKAEVTSGGVDLKELKGATLESRFQSGLYFAGEVCDVDGRIGGFNFQWAWASACAVAQSIEKSVKASFHQ